jgi:L-asparaginase
MTTVAPSKSNPKPSLAIFTTGGTFEKRYLESVGSLGFMGSCLPALVAKAKLAYKPRIEELMLIDSLEMGENERAIISARVNQAKETRIVIIHGTDTMTTTALALKQNLGSSPKKTVVLTGAMIPIAHDQSDGFFNLGLAIAASQMAQAGVYIAMSGCIYKAGEVKKDRRRKLFLPTV